MTTLRPDLPPPSAPNFNQRLRETVMTYLGKQGDKLDRGLTLRDVIAAGLFSLPAGYNPASLGSSSVPLVPGGNLVTTYVADLTPPPQPTGFTVSAAISNIFIAHDSPIFTQGHGYLRTNVYAATYTSGALPTFTDAVRITQFSGVVFAHAVNPSTTFRVWIKWESRDGVESAPAGGTNGLAVTTGQDVAKLVTAMTGPGNPFTILPVATVIGGVSFPAGTYSTNAFIQDAQITSAKIADLAVDNGKVANLSASKLTIGDGTVGGNLKSTEFSTNDGWQIEPNGLATFNNAVVRGTVYASAGTFAGSLSAATGTFSGSLSAATGTFSGSLSAATGTFTGNVSGGQFNTGGYTGYAWPAPGQTGSHLGPGGLLLGNADNGRYFQVEAGGNIYAPGFNVVNGTMTISQANIIDTLNIAGNAVTIPSTSYVAAAVSGASNDGTGTTLSTNGFTSTGQPVFISFGCVSNFSAGSDGGCQIVITVLRNNAVVFQFGAFTCFQGSITQAGAPPYLSLSFTDTPGAGYVTYSVITTPIAVTSYGFSHIYQNRSLLCLEVKR
jgi:hypothetical protein